MKRQAWVYAVVIVAVVALAGLIATLATRTERAVAPEEAGTPSATQPEAPGEPGMKDVAFAFHRLEIDTATQTGEACLVFTSALDDSGKTRYADYMALDPVVPVEARAQGNRLCLAGLTFGTDYTVTLRAGLPGALGKRLAAAETVPVSLRDRPPYVGFGEGFILPRAEAKGVPITTVNVAKVDVEVLRVGDKLLSQLRNDLVNERTIYGYDRYQIVNEQGRKIWSGTMDVTGQSNTPVVTLFPLRDVLESTAPGVYLLTARDAAKTKAVGEYFDEDWQGRAAQWIIDTDIGLTTYRGADGMHVFVRSLASAEPLDNVELVLVARDNGELGRTKPDRDGRAFFAPGLMRGHGGAEPILVMAYGRNGDFAYADLRRPAFDLSDRGVEGRTVPGPVDGYLFTERGIYRAGETVEMVMLLRDREARAIDNIPVTLVVRRPDGLEYRRLPVGPLKAGGAHIAVPLTETASRGRWSATAYLGTEDEPVGRVLFDVQDFVPERLKVTLTPPRDFLKPGDALDIGVDARFLYGAPAANLGGSGEARIVRAADPFPAFKGYRFGLAEEAFSPAMMTLDFGKTDEKGHTEASGIFDPALASSSPLEALVRIAVNEPGGRTTSEEATVPVRTGEIYLGLKPLFENDEVAENTDARFELVAVDAAGKALARPGLRYEIVQEETEYQWYQVDGEWRFDTVTRDRLQATGTVATTIEAPTPLTARVAWGAYRVTVRDGAKDAATSVRFYAGWGAGSSTERPDRITVASKSPRYKVGDKATISLRPPIPGKALVVIAADKVLATKLIDVPASGAEVSFDVSSEWGSGAYALVTLYRPLESEVGRAPARAIGLTWLAVDMSDRTLGLDIKAPEIVRPRTTAQIPIQVTNARPGEAIQVTLAAVDEGILQLTDYESPAPAAYYFGKRRLGIDIRDDYGRLIDAGNAATGPIRSGGDGLGGRGLTTVPTRTVALFSGLLSADAKGRVTVPLEIPDFVGELRLMATAFGPARLGEASRPLTVRDPVVAELSLPRFLAPGDEATATLLIDNVEGAAGPYKAVVGASGMVERTDAKAIEVSLAPKKQRVFGVPLKATAPGLSTLTVSLEGPGGLALKRAWPLEVRPAALPDFRQTVSLINPNNEAKVAPDLLAGLLPGTAALSIAVADRKGYDVPGLLKWLDRYPYGCIEQTTSRAMPLLYVGALAKAAGLATDEPVERRVQHAVERVVDMQAYDGSFGMWRPQGETADSWIGVFAADFLSEAKTKKFVVPDSVVTRTHEWLRRVAGNEGQPDAVRAYALYVLARSAAVPIGDVRYFYDTAHGTFKTAIAPAFAAAALGELGDRARAADGFAQARRLALESERATYEPLMYGSLLRDLAVVTTLTAAAGDAANLPALMARTAALEPPLALTTTQEKAWLVRAAHALEAAAADLAVDVTGTEAVGAKGAMVLTPSPAEIASGVSLFNKGSAPVWWTATATGTPEKPAPPATDGLTIQKRYYTLAGGPVDLAKVKQSERLVVSIEGAAAENVYRNAVVLDLLPAGLEIEAVVEPLPNGESPYPFLGTLTALSAAEARDDRFVAAFNLGDRYPDPKRAGVKPAYHVAYVVRAVTPGRFVLPGAQAEDMYQPAIRARTAAGSLTVTPAE